MNQSKSGTRIPVGLEIAMFSTTSRAIYLTLSEIIDSKFKLVQLSRVNFIMFRINADARIISHP